MNKDRTLDRLERIRLEFERELGYQPVKAAEAKDLTLFGLTPDEATDWLENEPDFAKRIATPLPTKRRRRVTLRNNIYISVLLEVTNCQGAR